MHHEATLYIVPDHPAFAGHFPGAPIVPGVVLLDAAVHAALQLLNLPLPDDQTGADLRHVCQISAAKFLSPVGPGETLTLSLNTLATGGIRFDIASGDRKVATGTLVLPSAS